MIRILHVGLTSNRGGTEAFVMQIYRAIDRSKVQFDFLVEYNKPLPFEEEIKELGGNVYYEYYQRRDANKPGAVTLADFFSRHPEIDGIHLNSNGLNTTFRVLQEAKRRNIPIRIIHSHNNGYIHKYGIKEQLYEIYAKLLLDSVVTKKLACSQEAGEWMFGKKPFTVVPNVIDVKKFAYNEEHRQMVRTKLGVGEDECLIGFVGSFNLQKDPEFSIQVCNELTKLNKGYKLVMLGQGPLMEAARAKIDELSLNENVILTGNVPNVQDYMQAMDAFLLPSCFEGFGIVLIEAQAAGLKCFTTKGTVPENTNVTGNVTFLDKSEGPAYWAEMINASYPFIRFDGQKALLDSVYNSEFIGEVLEQIYLEK